MKIDIKEVHSINIHNINTVKASAWSLGDFGGGGRFHVQHIKIFDDEGKEFCINLFFDKVSKILPVGDMSDLDQADSNEDYMGVEEGETVVF